jgi:amino acid adenylation domain-containing protein
VLGTRETLRLPEEWGAGLPGPAISVTEPLGEAAAGLRDLANNMGVPVKTIFLAAFAKVMSALAMGPSFLCGLVTNGRPEVIGGDEVFGMYLNTVPLELRRPAGSWRHLIHAAAAAEQGSWPHRRYPLPAMRAFVGGTQPLVEAVFNFLDFYVLDGSGVDLLQTQDDSPNEFPLQVTVVPGHLVLTAQPERIRAERLAALARAHRVVLQAMLADPDGAATGSVLPAAEQSALLQAASPADPGLTPAALPAMFARQARATPGAVAARDAERELSYAQLDDAAARLAVRLVAAGAGPDQPVGVLMRRSLDMVTTLLGILMSGAGYLPLDPEDPPARQAERLAAAGVRLVVADEDLRDQLPAVTVLSCAQRGQPAGRDTAQAACAGPNDLAYLMFTSGSTGGPKGVMIPHRGIGNYLQWLRTRHPIGAGDRIIQKTPYTFDVSVSEIFWPLICGATLVVAPPGLHRDPVGLAAFMTSQQVTHACFVPSMLDALLDAVDQVPACVREVYCAGEALRRSTVERLTMQSAARVHNMYGPTEASIIATAHVVPEPPAISSAEVPIGRAVDNTQAYVLDADLNLAAPGVAGQLYLGGIGLAYGYVGQAALTAAAFVPDPYGPEPGGRLYRTGDLARWSSGGVIDFLGRADHQVKISGVRIEPAEIEAALLRHARVRAAVVVARSEGGRARLVGYVVAQSGDLDADELRAFAATRLPALLVPASIVVLDELPLTSSGKVDRRALPVPATAGERRAHVAPRTPAEAAIAEAWQEELGSGPVGVEDDFVDAGGHSLAAMRIAIRLRQSHGLQVSPAALLLRRTVAGLAAILDGAVAGGAAAEPGTGTADAPPAAAMTPPSASSAGAAAASRRAGALAPVVPAAEGSMMWMRAATGAPALYCVHPGGGSAHWYRELASHLPDTLPVAAFQHPGLVDPAQASCPTEQLATRYIGELKQGQPEGTYHVFGWCGGAPIAWEMARRLREEGAEVNLILLDPVLQDGHVSPDGGDSLRLLAACDVAYTSLRSETAPRRRRALRAEVEDLMRQILIGHDGDLYGEDVLDEVWPVAVRSWRRQLEARLCYRYGKYDAKVSLLACDELAGGLHEGLSGLSFDRYLGHWRRLAPAGVECYRVTGGNMTSMLAPHVRATAGVVGRLVSGDQAGGGDG